MNTRVRGLVSSVAGFALLLTVGQGSARSRREFGYFENGRPMYEREYLGTREHGLHRGWWPDGTRRFEFGYQDGLLEGEGREWYADGGLFRVSHYARGHESGPQRMWDERGVLRASYDVRGGRRYGSIGAMGCTPGDSARAKAGSKLPELAQAGTGE